MILKTVNIDAKIGLSSIEAVYALNEYLAGQISPIDTMKFYPGDSAPTDAGRHFIHYMVIPTTDVELYMLHTDRIIYKIIHTSFERLQEMVYIFNKKLNVEDIQGIVTEPGLRFQFSHSNPVNAGNDFFDDSTAYFYQIVECTIKYQIL